MSRRKKGHAAAPEQDRGQANRPRKARKATGGAPQRTDPAPGAETSAARTPGRPARPAGTPAAAPAAPEHVLPRTYRPVAATAVPPEAAAEAAAETAGEAAAEAPAEAVPAPDAQDDAAPQERWTAEEAFDGLYVRIAKGLQRQVEVLTGDPAAARRAVTHAFALAWQRWPEVAQDSDPVGWVRAAAYEYALAPWQRWLPHRTEAPEQAHRPDHQPEQQPDPAEPETEPQQVEAPEQPQEVLTALAAALLELAPARRRAVLLYDGLGLDLAAAALESEATAGAMAGRIVGARDEVAAAVPALPDAAEGGVAAGLGALLQAGPAAGLPEAPAQVRDAGEREARRQTVGAYALTGLIALLTLVAVLVGPGTGSHASGPGAGPGSGPGGGAGAAGAGPVGAAAAAPADSLPGAEDAAGRSPFGEPARDLLP